MSSDKDFHDKTAKINLEYVAEVEKAIELAGQTIKVGSKRLIELREAHRRVFGHALKAGCGQGEANQ